MMSKTVDVFREANPDLPTIVVLATGGTIAGAGSIGKATNYRPGQLDVHALVGMAEGAHDIANVRAVQICNVNSDDITAEHWLSLARAIDEMAGDPDIDGFVVTHGTDTMEETAYFLHLTVRTDKPVVMTGAMRPPTAISPDGAMNLCQAVLTAACDEARGKGVLLRQRREGRLIRDGDARSVVELFYLPGGQNAKEIAAVCRLQQERRVFPADLPDHASSSWRALTCRAISSTFSSVSR